VRAYTRGTKTVKFWTGYYNLKVTCTYFGLPITIPIAPADTQEWDIFPEAIRRVEAITGPRHVRSVIADKGFAVRPVFNDCHKRGITLIAPLRKEAGDDHSPADRDAFERDGNPRCKHRGGPPCRSTSPPNPSRGVHITSRACAPAAAATTTPSPPSASGSPASNYARTPA
jgi:hypothetical protein